MRPAGFLAAVVVLHSPIQLLFTYYVCSGCLSPASRGSASQSRASTTGFGIFWWSYQPPDFGLLLPDRIPDSISLGFFSSLIVDAFGIGTPAVFSLVVEAIGIVA